MELLRNKIKIIIADDHPVFRSGLEMALKTMNFVSKVSQAANGEEVLKLLDHEAYDVILMDIKMSPMDGIQTTEVIRTRHPDAKVIALSMHDDEKIILEVLEKGASGYLIKNADRKEIEEAIKYIMEGHQYFSKPVSEILLKELNRRKASKTSLANEEIMLKERFRDIIFLICHELTNVEIGDALCLSGRTIEDYRKKILESTESRNIFGLVKYAISHGIMEDPELEKKFQKNLKKKEKK